jgi:zinc transport system ATP-binding protein
MLLGITATVLDHSHPEHETERQRTAPREGEPVFHLADVNVQYGSEVVLESVSFDVVRGEFVGVLGPNGSGKTTLLRTMLGLQPPTRGVVEVFGKRAASTASKLVGYVSQHASMPPKAVSPFTVADVVATGRASIRGLGLRLNQQDRDLCKAAIARVGLAEKAGARLNALSGGQRQRAFLARALAGEPEVLVLDEPTTGLDRTARTEFFTILDELNHHDNLTIVLVSHDTDAVLDSAHRILSVNRRILFDGPCAAYQVGKEAA